MNSILAAAWIGTLVHGWTGESKRYELMQEAGIGLVRCEVGWKNCEKRRGEYVLPEHVENELKIMKNLGIKVNMLLSYDNPEVYPENPLDPEAFANWAIEGERKIKLPKDAIGRKIYDLYGIPCGIVPVSYYTSPSPRD